MRTLKEIIETKAKTDIEKAIQAAYWAGQSDMRGQITEDLAKRAREYRLGRYHNIERRAMMALLESSYINTNAEAFGGYGDSGKGEAAEILEWDFDI